MFAEKAITIKNIDKSGSDVYRRYQYQIACVFVTFLSFCKQNENFYVLLDYFDDFVLIENPNLDNEKISFVQVKTNDKNFFTLNLVIKEEWIKKQAVNDFNFLDLNVRNILLTNCGIKINKKLIDSETPICINTFEDSEQILKIKKQIKNETGKEDYEKYFIVKSKLSLSGFNEQIKGLMLDYVNSNKMGALTSEAIETIYKTIWMDLSKKQQNTISEEEAKNYQIILEKKAMKYSRIKDIFRVAIDIQIPESGKIADFFDRNNLYVESMDRKDFALLFKGFRTDCAKNGMLILEECWNYIRDNNSCIDTGMNWYNISKQILELFDGDIAINSSIFYTKYRLCISVLFTYKLYEF